MEGLEKIKHAKKLVDSHFETLINEFGTLSDLEIIDETIEMAGAIFNMAEGFGYYEMIEKIIDNE